jgi:hypothetical protein
MGSNDGNGPTTVQAASIPSRLEDRVPNQRPTVLQLRMTGTDTGQGPTPMRIFKESFYAERDLFVRPAVGGDSRMEGNAKKGIKGPYTRQEVSGHRILRFAECLLDRMPSSCCCGVQRCVHHCCMLFHDNVETCM